MESAHDSLDARILSRRSFVFGSLATLVLSTNIPQVLASPFSSYQQKYDTIAHKFLEVELDVGVDSSHYRQLDYIIDTAKRILVDEKKLVQSGKEYSPEDIRLIFETITQMLETMGYKMKPLINPSLFHWGLTERKALNCSDYSIIFVSIGQVLNIPIKAVLVPDHVFIHGYSSSGIKISYDPQNKMEINEQEGYHISPKSKKHGIYLRDLTDTELIAISHQNMANFWLNEGKNISFAIADFNESLRLLPNDPMGLAGLGYAYYTLGDASSDKDKAQANFRTAVTYFNKSLDSDPDHFKSHYLLAVAYNSLGDHKKAQESLNEAYRTVSKSIWDHLAILELSLTFCDHQKVIQHTEYLFSEISQARKNKGDNAIFQDVEYPLLLIQGMAYAGLENYEKAREIFDSLIIKDPNNPNAYLAKSRVYCKMGDQTTARNVYDLALANNSIGRPFPPFEMLCFEKSPCKK